MSRSQQQQHCEIQITKTKAFSVLEYKKLRQRLPPWPKLPPKSFWWLQVFTNPHQQAGYRLSGQKDRKLFWSSACPWPLGLCHDEDVGKWQSRMLAVSQFLSDNFMKMTNRFNLMNRCCLIELTHFWCIKATIGFMPYYTLSLNVTCYVYRLRYLPVATLHRRLGILYFTFCASFHEKQTTETFILTVNTFLEIKRINYLTTQYK